MTSSNIIFILLIILFVLIYLSLYYSKSLTEKYESFKEYLAKWLFSLFTSRDGKTIITKNVL